MISRTEFLAHHHRVRARTERLIPLIPEHGIEWRPCEGAFSFGDLLRHLAGLERWMWAENVVGRPSRYPGHGLELAPGYRATIDYAVGCRNAALEIFASLSDEDMLRRVSTPGGASMPAWKWLRAMTEHEAHHRGQLYLMLRLRGIASPPLYGLTSEQVTAAGSACLNAERGVRGGDARGTRRMSSESRLITLATAQDARQISELLFAAFVAFKPQYTPEGFSATTLAPEQVAARMSEGPTWIAHVDGRIAGTVSALPLEQEVYIRSMAVLPEARGTGVGTRLLQEVTEFAVRQKAHRMTLTTTPFLHEAIRLYERAGFLRLRAPLDLHGTPLFLMTRPLPPHPCAPCDGSASATAIPPQSASSD